MQTNEHLFGTNDVPEFPQNIINERLELLNDNLSELLDHTTYTRTKEQAGRIDAILKAIKWHQNINKMGEQE